MSSKDPRKFLFDIIEAAKDIEVFVAGMTLEDYSADTQVKAAVERKFEIIGEALNRIKRVSPELLSEITDGKLCMVETERFPRKAHAVIVFPDVPDNPSGC